METFTKYRLINELNGNIVYYLAINDNELNHDERLQNKKIEKSYEKNIPLENLFWEEYF